MFRKYVLPGSAVVGVLLAVYTVLAGQRIQPPAQPITQPAQPQFDSYVAGAGIVEASTENIAVGTFVPGVVTAIFVKVGDHVRAGAPLFGIDDRDLKSELTVRQAAELSAQARVKTESASLADVKNQLDMWLAVNNTGAVSKDEVDRKRYAVQIQEAKLAQAQADATSAAAQVKATEIEIDRRMVKAPVEGDVLQVKVRLGEYAPAGALSTPLMMMGDTRTLHVRVDVDENDAWRVSSDARATAHVRGNRDIKTDLTFFGIEPYVVPKKSLTGDSTERVDTRVLQVIYAFDRGKLPIYVGQQMDVFIDAPPAAGGAAMAMAAAAAVDTQRAASSSASGKGQ